MFKKNAMLGGREGGQFEFIQSLLVFSEGYKLTYE